MPLSLRTAFTLIEMMVVMLIITTLMGIGVGAWYGSAAVNEQAANQQLLSGLIQQARNRSLSSNEPVVLRLDKDNGTIFGLHKQHMFYANSAYSSLSGSARARDDIGRPIRIENEDGLAIRCSINAPPAGTATDNIIPIALLCSNAGEAWIDSSNIDLKAGIELWRVPQFIDHSGTRVKVAETWAVVAWSKQRPDYPSARNSYTAWNSFKNGNNFVRTWDNQNATDPASISLDEKRYGFRPYTGDSWIDIELLFDGLNLYLFQNGIERDFLEDLPLSQHPPIDDYSSLYIGSHLYGTDKDERLAIADIDDVSVMRAGSGSAESFIGSLLPQTNYKIVCKQGAIRCYREDPDNPGTYDETSSIHFVDSELKTNSFRISIGSDGSVLSQKIFTSEDITDPEFNAEPEE